MKVLVVGSGGREHALCWKLSLSPRVSAVHCAPGNDGMAGVATLHDVKTGDLRGLAELARQIGADLTVVGPEEPLVLGIADWFHREGLRLVGPTQAAARLEGSKRYAKELMRKHSIPTAEHRVFTQPEPALSYIEEADFPLVVKADGLAAGKGVTVCRDAEEARSAIVRLQVEREHGDAGRTLLIEEYLDGQELSVLALTDGHTIAPFELARDYKRLKTGDTGPNTGGMGAISPVPLGKKKDLAKLQRSIDERILIPILHACRREEHPYSGVLYAGLMLTLTGPRVLEWNVRFGDPETQPLLMRLTSDLYDLLDRVANGTLDEATLEWDARTAVCVVAASEGYPGTPKTNRRIKGLDSLPKDPDVQVFHAATKQEGGDWYTTGGRVLSVTALGDTPEEAREKAYKAMEGIHFKGMQVRDDIGAT